MHIINAIRKIKVPKMKVIFKCINEKPTLKTLH